jgi:hypothetical protein
MNNYIAVTQEQDMLSSVRDSSSSIDFDMVDFGSSDELAHSYQVADMEVENERMVLLTCESRQLPQRPGFITIDAHYRELTQVYCDKWPYHVYKNDATMLATLCSACLESLISMESLLLTRLVV